MELFFASFSHVTWWIIGVILIVFEIFTGGTFLLWLGVAALSVGAVMYFVPIDWQLQLVLFAVISIGSIIIWRKVQKRRKEYPEDPQNPHLSRRGEQYIGQVFILATPIVNGVGKVKVADTLWQVKSDKDMKRGQKVKVLSVKGASFIVGDTDENV